MDCAPKNHTEKRSGVLTYDTALQVVAGTAQQDLFLNLILFGRHFIGFLLLAGVEATIWRVKWEVGGDAKAESGAGLARGKCRTSCGSIDEAKEKERGNCGRRGGGGSTESSGQSQWLNESNVELAAKKRRELSTRFGAVAAMSSEFSASLFSPLT